MAGVMQSGCSEIITVKQYTLYYKWALFANLSGQAKSQSRKNKKEAHQPSSCWLTVSRAPSTSLIISQMERK